MLVARVGKKSRTRLLGREEDASLRVGSAISRSLCALPTRDEISDDEMTDEHRGGQKPPPNSLQGP